MHYSTSIATGPRFLLTASWILPVASPAILDGGILIDGGKILALLSAAEVSDLQSAQPQLPHEHRDGEALTPGLINLHTHLDYTNLASLEAFDGQSMFDWLEDLVSQSRSPQNTPLALYRSALAGAMESAMAGVSYVVDSTFSGGPARALAKVGLKGLVGLELFGLDGDRAELLFQLWQEKMDKLAGGWLAGGPSTVTAGDAQHLPKGIDETLAKGLTSSIKAGRIRLTIAPHAPYTVAPPLWLKAKHWARERGLPLTCHLSESDNEVNWIASDDQRLHQYLLKVMPRNPDKDLASMLKNLSWRGDGRTPCAHLDHNDLLDERTLAAHCLKVKSADMKFLANKGVKVALCPRSNQCLKNGLPDPAPFIDGGVTFGLGTDSRASSPSLSVRDEARQLRQNQLDACITQNFYH
jgi:cytosine/adenosine deaminase-related metal-dependent hydrolase